jgi:hypothetical protein
MLLFDDKMIRDDASDMSKPLNILIIVARGKTHDM